MEFRSKKDGSHYPISNGKTVYPTVEENTENFQGYILKTVKRSDYSFPYHIEIYNPAGEQIGKTLQIETLTEVEQTKSQIKKDLEKKIINKDTYLNGIKSKYESEGFKVTIHSEAKGFYDPKMTIEKDGLAVNLTETELQNEDYVTGAYKYFPVIKQVYDDWKGQGDVFYSTINSNVDSQMKNAKSGYRAIVFSSVTDNLRKHGVNVHS